MAKTQLLENDDGTHKLLVFWCPGCQREHPFTVASTTRNPWTWNGDRERPTCEPSLLVEPNRPQDRCHLFLRDGVIQFLDDCHHALKGQSVPLPDMPEDA